MTGGARGFCASPQSGRPNRASAGAAGWIAAPRARLAALGQRLGLGLRRGRGGGRAGGRGRRG